MGAWNVFRVTGDCLHLLSKCILIFSIHRNRSAEGVSLITQMLYALVFVTRYLNIFQDGVVWNIFFRIFYITSSFYIIAIMRWVYPRSRELELAWKMGAGIVVSALVLSPFGMMIFQKKMYWSFLEWLWSFSEILESVAVLPQLLLLRQTSVPTVIDSYYLLALGSYRGFYILNWIERGADPNDHLPNLLSVIFGIVQTLLYLDFAWVYWTRQRVKLRNGGIVDADDIRQGWLLSRIFGKHVNRAVDDDVDGAAADEESAPALGRSTRGRGGGRGGVGGAAAATKWGGSSARRGLSIRADDATLEQERLFQAERSDGHHNLDASVDPDARMHDPDDLARALVEEEDYEDGNDSDEDGAPPPPPSSSSSKPQRGADPANGVRNDEWVD